MNYVDSRSKVFRHLNRLVGWDTGDTPAPVTVEWDLSNRCYLGCQDCHFAHTHVRGPWASKDRILPMAYDGTGDLADMGLVKRALKEMAVAGVQGIVWSGGGEPTTHPQFAQALALASSYRLRQGLYTAGGLLTQDSADVIADLCEWVVVSLDTRDAKTYQAEKGVTGEQFAKASQGIRWLSAGKAVIGVSFLLHELNWNKATSMLALARALGATYTTFRPAIKTSPDQPSVCTDDRSWIDHAATTLEHLSEQPDVELDLARFRNYQHWAGHGYTDCHGIRLNTTVTPDGRVWLCPQRRGVSCLGDLRIESFETIWERHPGTFRVDAGCRVMCRLHPVNETLASIERPRAHEAFV
jgi:MoaA/NifB/PqqE/SkfB family radical SAM enzyme